MKKVLFLALAFALGIAAFGVAQTKHNALASSELNAVMTFQSLTHDFGDVRQHNPVTYEFEFTNTGDSPLIISEVKASCGCTATGYPKQAIQPGETSSIKATYNAASVGNFVKSIYVTANTEEGSQILVIKGTVLE